VRIVDATKARIDTTDVPVFVADASTTPPSKRNDANFATVAFVFSSFLLEGGVVNASATNTGTSVVSILAFVASTILFNVEIKRIFHKGVLLASLRRAPTTDLEFSTSIPFRR
jgi:hypothetical protein